MNQNNETIVSIHQPAYIPWLGYFDKIAKSNIHIILDDAEYSKNDLFNRNIINTPNGWIWLTIPVNYKNKTPINQIKIDNSKKWRKKHWNSIKLNYAKAPFFKEYSKNFEKLYSQEWGNLSDFTNAINKEILNILGIKTKLIKSSEINPKGQRNEKLLNLCKATQATTYLSGEGAKDPKQGAYINEALFLKNNIKVNYQGFKHPEYEKIWKETNSSINTDEVSNFSILDILFTLGKDKVKKLIEK